MRRTDDQHGEWRKGSDIGYDLSTITDPSPCSVADFSPLSACTRLEVLKLYGSYSAELQTISCANVRVLQLSETDVSDLSHLHHMPRVAEIDLSQTYVSDISPLICHAATLQSLDLSHTSVSDITVLGLCTQLRKFNISFTSICDLEPLRVCAWQRMLEGAG